MNLLRRRYLQQSVALAASPAPGATSSPHVVLLGDAIFDNGACTGGKPDVIAHCRRVLPRRWKASLLARDGAFIDDVFTRLAKLPPDTPHLVLRAGGNDALQHQSLLQARASAVANANASARQSSAQIQVSGPCFRFVYQAQGERDDKRQ